MNRLVLLTLVALAAATSEKPAPEPIDKTIPNATIDKTGAAADEDEVPGWSVPVGIVMGLSASVGINVGNNIQAMALAQMQEKEVEKKPRIFWVGTAIFAIASILNFVAFGFAPAAVLAPLESVQFVSNLMFARFVNKEHVSLRMCAGSGLVITGTIVAIVVGPSSVAKLSIADLKALWIEPAWIGYLVGVAAAFTACMVVHMHYQRQLDAGRKLRGYRVVLPFTFALSSAFVGSQAVVHAKTMSELVELVFTIGPLGLLSSWFFYFACVLLFATMGMWLYRLNAALGKYDPLFIIPLLQANYILFSTVTGGIYFKEFAELTVFSAAMFGLGVAIMFVGLYLLAPVTSFEEDQVVIPFPRPLHAQTTRLCTSRPNDPPSRPPIPATDLPSPHPPSRRATAPRCVTRQAARAPRPTPTASPRRRSGVLVVPLPTRRVAAAAAATAWWRPARWWAGWAASASRRRCGGRRTRGASRRC